MSTRAKNVAPVYLEPGVNVTCTAADALTGCTLVAATTGGLGNRPAVTTATAAKHAYGVTGCDTAKDAPVAVQRAGTVGVTAAEALTSGDLVEVGTDGKAAKNASGTVIGVCVADTAKDGTAPITLSL